jgi:hypothetical protein
VAHALAATREATVVHVYNTAMISKRVHLHREKQRFSRSTACRVLPRKIGRRSHLAGLTLLHELECVVGASVVGGGAKSDQRCARGFCRFAIHTQAWSSPREEGLRYKWDEPRDPAASLADPTLGRVCHEKRCEKRAMDTITIHGEKFTGNPRDWKDARCYGCLLQTQKEHSLECPSL